jgi:hypothetical protein
VLSHFSELSHFHCYIAHSLFVLQCSAVHRPVWRGFKTLTAGGGDGNKTSTCINAHFTGKTNPTPLMRRDGVPEPSNNIDYSLGKKVRKGKK